MRSKEYLQRIRKIDLLILNKTEECMHWQDVARSITAQMNGERVQSSGGSQQKMADAIAKYLDIGDDYAGEIAELKAERRRIIATIEQLNATEYDLLYKIYVRGLDFQEVADTCDRSKDWVKTVHGRALQSVQTIIDHREPL